MKNMLRVYYDLSSKCLEEYLPCIPRLKYSNAQSYLGKISRLREGIYKTITLSEFNLITDERLMDEEDTQEILDTIAHEFAHMTYWKHGEEHTALTQSYLNIINESLKQNNKLAS